MFCLKKNCEGADFVIFWGASHKRAKSNRFFPLFLIAQNLLGPMGSDDFVLLTQWLANKHSLGSYFLQNIQIFSSLRDLKKGSFIGNYL